MRAFFVSAFLLLAALPASAQLRDFGAGAMQRPGDYSFKTGEETYTHVCQTCHMPGGRGAMGAGAGYPALTNNPKLAEPGYPVAVVLHGQKAMLPLGGLLSDQQVADVVNYVRSHFGNNYSNKVTAADVKVQR
jgi:mono/diheme cytochrome c family protein